MKKKNNMRGKIALRNMNEKEKKTETILKIRDEVDEGYKSAMLHANRLIDL